MGKNDFWFLSLVALLIISSCFSWSPLLRVAVIANSAIVLCDAVRQARRLLL